MARAAFWVALRSYYCSKWSTFGRSRPLALLSPILFPFESRGFGFFVPFFFGRLAHWTRFRSIRAPSGRDEASRGSKSRRARLAARSSTEIEMEGHGQSSHTHMMRTRSQAPPHPLFLYQRLR
jgi:hypothetical protein